MLSRISVFITVVILLGFAGDIVAQNSTASISIFTDSLNSKGVAEVKHILDSGKMAFVPSGTTQDHFSPSSTFWIHICFQNTENIQDYVLSFQKRVSLMEVYPYPFSAATGYSGLMVPGRWKGIPGCNVLIAGGVKGYLVKVQNRVCSNITVNDLKLIPALVFEGQRRKTDLIQGFIQGFLWLMLLYNIMLYFVVKQKIHLFYILYVLFNSLYLFFSFDYSDIYLFPGNYHLNLLLRTFQMIGVFFYIMFLRHTFLSHCSTYSRTIDRKLFLPFAYFVLFLNIVLGSTILYRIDIFVKMVGLVNIFDGLVALIGFIYFYKGADWFVRIVVIGSVFMIVGGSVSVLNDLFYMPSNDWYYEMGLFIELLLFSYALNRQYVWLIEERYKAMLAKDKLENELDIKNRELVYQAIQLSAKDEAIAAITDKIKDYRHNHSGNLTNLINIETEIISYKSANLWKEFELHFNETHPGFYKALNTNYPDLTQSEMKLCALLKLNLNTKEISSITQKSTRSIEVMRSRIRQKMNLTRDGNLSQVLINY